MTCKKQILGEASCWTFSGAWTVLWLGLTLDANDSSLEQWFFCVGKGYLLPEARKHYQGFVVLLYLQQKSFLKLTFL